MKIEFSASSLIENINKIVEWYLDPAQLLRMVVEQHGAPILTCSNPFDPYKGKNITNATTLEVCYGVYVDPNRTTSDDFHGKHSVFMLLGKDKITGELFTTKVDDYLSFFFGRRDDCNEKRGEFAEHFLKELGLTLDEVRESVKESINAEIRKNFAPKTH